MYGRLRAQRGGYGWAWSGGGEGSRKAGCLNCSIDHFGSSKTRTPVEDWPLFPRSGLPPSTPKDEKLSTCGVAGCRFLWVRNEVKLPAFSAGFTTASQELG